jgi:hypothetical protein
VAVDEREDRRASAARGNPAAELGWEAVMTTTALVTTTALIPTFRYDHFSPEMKKALQETATRIRAQVRTATKAVIEIGRELISIKRQLEHGQFTEWVEIECGFSLRSAENYMRAAAFAIGKSETVSLLRPATAYRLAAKSAPPEVVSAVIRSIEAGHIPTDSEIDVMFDRARNGPRLRHSMAPAGTKDKACPDELAALIISRLGPELARELVECWAEVGERLSALLEPQSSLVSSVPAADSVAAATPTSTHEQADDGASRVLSELKHRVELVRDEKDENLYRPKSSAASNEADGLDIPDFLDRRKTAIGPQALAAPAP